MPKFHIKRVIFCSFVAYASIIMAFGERAAIFAQKFSQEETGAGIAAKDKNYLQIMSGGGYSLVKSVSLEIINHEYAVLENLDQASRSLGLYRLPAKGEFSLNQRLGARTFEKGYKEARVYAGNGMHVSEMGGGICMVSTILYRLFLYSGLEILERHPHMHPVAYSVTGLDATINWKYKDLKVRNDSDYPFAFFIYRQGRVLYANLFSPKPENITIEIKRKTERATIPGRKRNGYRIRTERLFWKDGSLIKKDLISIDAVNEIN